MSSEDKNRVVGVALCGFGRAGHIHFHGIRQNHHARLKYVVDMIGEEGVLERIAGCLAEYHMTHVQPVSKEQFDEVYLCVYVNVSISVTDLSRFLPVSRFTKSASRVRPCKVNL